MNRENSAATASLGFRGRLYSLIAAVLTVGLASYFVAPMLPIFCVETVARGGLGWSRTDACSLYGTYMLIAHIAPFIGGIFADVLFGHIASMLLGYLFAGYGIVLLWFFPETMMVPGFLLYGLGTGCVKVGLATAVGTLCSGPFSDQRNKAYEYHYFVSCIGFIVGNFFSNLFYDLWGMKTLFIIGSVAVLVSLIFYLCCRPRTFKQSVPKEEESGSLKEISIPWMLLGGLLGISILYFACGYQLNSSLSIYLFQQVDRVVFGWAVPALWFIVFGYIVMIALSPLRRKLWEPFERTISFIEPVKLGVGLALLGIGFALFSGCAAFPENLGKGPVLLLLLLGMGVFFISDAHVRPLLFSSATKFAPQKYRTIASAVVYSTVGLGGKLAGFLAGGSDMFGFAWLFSICAAISGFSCVATLLLWKWHAKRSPQLEEASA